MAFLGQEPSLEKRIHQALVVRGGLKILVRQFAPPPPAVDENVRHALAAIRLRPLGRGERGLELKLRAGAGAVLPQVRRERRAEPREEDRDNEVAFAGGRDGVLKGFGRGVVPVFPEDDLETDGPITVRLNVAQDRLGRLPLRRHVGRRGNENSLLIDRHLAHPHRATQDRITAYGAEAQAALPDENGGNQLPNARSNTVSSFPRQVRHVGISLFGQTGSARSKRRAYPCCLQ